MIRVLFLFFLVRAIMSSFTKTNIRQKMDKPRKFNYDVRKKSRVNLNSVFNEIQRNLEKSEYDFSDDLTELKERISNNNTQAPTARQDSLKSEAKSKPLVKKIKSKEIREEIEEETRSLSDEKYEEYKRLIFGDLGEDSLFDYSEDSTEYDIDYKMANRTHPILEGGKDSIRKAILLKEVLDRPLSLRK